MLPVDMDEHIGSAFDVLGHQQQQRRVAAVHLHGRADTVMADDGKQHPHPIDDASYFAVRAAALNVGYAVGDSLYRSSNRLVGIAGVLIVALANELVGMCIGNRAWKSSAMRYVGRRVQHVVVITRYFCIAALLTTAADSIKMSFTCDVPTVATLLMIIAVAECMVDRITGRE